MREHGGEEEEGEDEFIIPVKFQKKNMSRITAEIASE